MIIAEALANAIAPSLSFLAAPASRVIVSVAGVSDILVEALTSTGAAFAGSTNYAEVLEDVTILPGASTDLPTVPITFAPNGSGRLDVLATVGWTPRLTTFHSVPANGVGDFIPVPSHAQSVTLLGTFAVGDITSVAAFTIPVTGAVLYQAASPTPNLDQFAFAIARGVEFIQLSNGTGQEIQVLLLWTIGL